LDLQEVQDMTLMDEVAGPDRDFEDHRGAVAVVAWLETSHRKTSHLLSSGQSRRRRSHCTWACHLPGGVDCFWDQWV